MELNTKIKEIPEIISVPRVYHGLKNYGIKTVKDLISLTENELKDIELLGKKSLIYITDLVDEWGLSFADEKPSADEMFEKLGFELKINNINEDVPEDFILLQYKNNDDVEINFYNDREKSFSIVRKREYYYATKEMLQVMYKKYTELGWIK